jgi:hypothetical protein
MSDGPVSSQLGTDRTETHLITHASWNSMPHMFSYGSNETGIRRIENGIVVNDSFELIQHGWHDWKQAGEVIKRLLEKGRSARRIYDVMEFIKDRNGLLLRAPGRSQS